MDKCVIDTSTSDLILMIGGQLLLLGAVLFIIFFGKMPITFPLGKFSYLVGSNPLTNAVSSTSTNAKSENPATAKKE
jgi:hypothetical protein